MLSTDTKKSRTRYKIGTCNKGHGEKIDGSKAIALHLFALFPSVLCCIEDEKRDDSSVVSLGTLEVMITEYLFHKFSVANHVTKQKFIRLQ